MRRICLLVVLVAALSISTMTPAVAHDFLLIGSQGPAVVRWQQQLNVVRDRDIAVDGIYGPITAGATRDFQNAAGITVDGVVGPQTRHAMRHALEDRPLAPGPGEPTPRSDLALVRENLLIQRGDRGEPVAAVQRLISSTRQGNIAVDGIFGPETEGAVRDFQWAQRILVDGIVGPQTVRALERALDL